VAQGVMQTRLMPRGGPCSMAAPTLPARQATYDHQQQGPNSNP